MPRRLIVAVLALAAARPVAAASSHEWCGTSRHGAQAAALAHQERRHRERGLRRQSVAQTVTRVGQIAVLTDEGDLALLRNDLDLRGVGLRFTPSGGGYTIARVDQPLQAAQGSRLPLGDDDGLAQALPFDFPFYARGHRTVFVNSDGNVTFEEADRAWRRSSPTSIRARAAPCSGARRPTGWWSPGPTCRISA